MTLASRIKELRTTRHMTQQELADECDVAKSTISLWESGKRLPDRDNLQALSDIFNVQIDYLLGKSNYTIRYLSTVELDMIDAFRRLDSGQQQLVLNMLGVKRDAETSSLLASDV